MRILSTATICLTLAGIWHPAHAVPPDEETLKDAWTYLIGRAMVVRQEKFDTTQTGVDYNEIKYNPAGEPIGWVNPNLDVANNEAWIAVDADTPAILEIPQIDGRYYTAQIIDEWGEVITNINQRNYPQHPLGKYAFALQGTDPEIPADAVHIDLRSPKAKMLARVEIAGDLEGAIQLQEAFRLSSSGTPQIAPTIAVPDFDNQDLPGVELFDLAEELLSSAPDISPYAAQLQVKVRDVVDATADPGDREAIERMLHDTIIPGFQKFSVEAAGKIKNNWMGSTVIGNYGEDFAIRSAANYIGIWANTTHEVIYFVATRDGDGNPLGGANTYVIDFPADARPDEVVNAYWSLSLVDVPGFLAVENEIDRYTFNSVAPPPASEDGSLKIYMAPTAGPDVPQDNWLPTPDGKPFSLTFRA
ncbi:DUF1214 domain-containing protein [Paracoccus sp. (in: a-proteobacteria)]|uniref:DUF1214 domain-containing protein n=1 Tax=Paracoccus sp. TaxID=267 RepID=UPI0028A8A6A2|nr:DUF1214 domain-containing protein [Paracoccus sp. (in: a-proteobacteria)]